MKINYNNIGLRKNYLYEVLATTFTKVRDKIVPNTASMGIRLIEENIIKMTPYPDTTTYKNLKENGYASINFCDNIHLFTLASLKDPNSQIGLKEFPTEFYEYYEFINAKSMNGDFKQLKESEKIIFPYIKQAWAIAFCETIEESQITKDNMLGRLRLSEFKLRIYSLVKKRESFKLFNRAENLVLESLILATRLKLAKERDKKQLFDKIHNKLRDYMQSIEKFSKNEESIDSLGILSKYINNLTD
ncbi:MAG: DUF447 domain-containing protein [Promethearchaeota archaeon]